MFKEVSNAARENGTEYLQKPSCRVASCATRSAGQLAPSPLRPSSYLSNPVDLLLVRLSDVEDASVRQGDRRGALQGGVYGQLTQAVVNARHLAVHGPARDDAHLRRSQR